MFCSHIGITRKYDLVTPLCMKLWNFSSFIKKFLKALVAETPKYLFSELAQGSRIRSFKMGKKALLSLTNVF